MNGKNTTVTLFGLSKKRQEPQLPGHKKAKKEFHLALLNAIKEVHASIQEPFVAAYVTVEDGNGEIIYGIGSAFHNRDDKKAADKAAHYLLRLSKYREAITAIEPSILEAVPEVDEAIVDLQKTVSTLAFRQEKGLDIAIGRAIAQIKRQVTFTDQNGEIVFYKQREADGVYFLPNYLERFTHYSREMTLGI